MRVISPDVFFSEEQRPNIHVIGSSRQGKSRFIEWLMREDIDRGIGCCLLDPTSGGETAKRMLLYCAEQGRDKVLYIDTEHSYHPYKKTIGLQPFKYDRNGQAAPKLRHLSLDMLMGAIRSLYNVKDPAEQSRIERYLPSVLTALYDAKRPIADAIHLSNRLDADERYDILAETDPITRMALQEPLEGPIPLYLNYQSTIGRVGRFTKGLLGQMFSVTQGVDWMKVVREHWAVIVRLDNLDFFDARVLGTYIIAELESAKARLNNLIDNLQDADNWGKYPPFYLYADEAYMFATHIIKNVLDLKQKMNFKVTLAHHTAAQFKQDPEVYDSIKTNCDMTVEFYIKSRKDRDEIAGEMYGGDIDPKDASYANSNIPKQSAVIKIGKANPVRTRIADVPTPDISRDQLRDYTLEIYRNDWYRNTDELIRTQHVQPTVQPRPAKNPRTPRPDPKVNNPPANKAPRRETAFDRAKREGTK